MWRPQNFVSVSCGADKQKCRLKVVAAAAGPRTAFSGVVKTTGGMIIGIKKRSKLAVVKKHKTNKRVEKASTYSPSIIAPFIKADGYARCDKGEASASESSTMVVSPARTSGGAGGSMSCICLTAHPSTRGLLGRKSNPNLWTTLDTRDGSRQSREGRSDQRTNQVFGNGWRNVDGGASLECCWTQLVVLSLPSSSLRHGYG
jgi:hypothetical protein